MRVAVFGLGSAGVRHAGNLLSLGCDVYGWDSEMQRCVEAESSLPLLKVPFRVSIEAMDAVVVATPWHAHLEYAAQALYNRKALFVEKPIGDVQQLSSWRRLLPVASGLVTQTGYQCRFHRGAQALRLLAPACSGFFATACDMRTWPGKSYGPLLLEASHDLDLALSMGASPAVTEAVIEPNYVGISLGPNWRITIEDYADYRREWTVEQRGQSMTVTFDSPQALGDRMYYDAMAHFIDCVREGRQTNCPLGEGVKVLEVAAQVEQIARQAA